MDLRGDLRAAVGLGEDEGALQYGLHVQGEALGAPWRFDAALRDGSGDVGLDFLGVLMMRARRRRESLDCCRRSPAPWCRRGR